MLIGGRRSGKLFFWVFNSEDRMSVATVTKYLLKALAISCDSVKPRPLSKILDGATLGNSFKEIKILYTFPCILSVIQVVLEIICKIRFFYCLSL